MHVKMRSETPLAMPPRKYLRLESARLKDLHTLTPIDIITVGHTFRERQPQATHWA
jgi:hypothetical protein